jgi:hypothetical protein
MRGAPKLALLGFRVKELLGGDGNYAIAAEAFRYLN